MISGIIKWVMSPYGGRDQVQHWVRLNSDIWAAASLKGTGGLRYMCQSPQMDPWEHQSVSSTPRLKAVSNPFKGILPVQWPCRNLGWHNLQRSCALVQKASTWLMLLCWYCTGSMTSDWSTYKILYAQTIHHSNRVHSALRLDCIALLIKKSALFMINVNEIG